ncbi:NADH dehydrogenase [ubiquinone] iron-sulfur protein 6, mitochondrial-like [Diadema setosum]|uniref:NADH dehydrogenase [ubiquinone] iron-sulfur protein 6, mitochondrial-like n=1 Tax=Diadema setosum TaxID=31175 RepID=UPI003B3BC323
MAALRCVLLSRTCCRRLPQLSPLSRSVAVHTKPNSSGEKVTHTGQAFDDGDYRRIRFVDRQKEVNEKFAIDLVDEEPPIVIQGRSVYCDGGGGPLGHPKVYINLDQEGPQVCPYCGLRYISAMHLSRQKEL